MSELRWILLGIGLVVIAAVFFFSRRGQKRKTAEPGRRGNLEPHLGGAAEPYFESTLAREPEAAVETPEPVFAAEPEPDAVPPDSPDATAPRSEPLILALNVVAADEDDFAPKSVLAALAAAGLRPGQHQIYEFPDKGGDGNWFSAANMVEPGQFPPPDSGDRVPGIALFMALPGIDDPHAALDAMLAAARRLASDLDGNLEDMRHKPFTAQAAQNMREKLSAYQAASRQPIRP